MTLLEKVIYLNYFEQYDLDELYLDILEFILEHPEDLKINGKI